MYNYWFVCRRNAASEFVSFVRFAIVFVEFCCVSVCLRAYRRNKKDNSENKTVSFVGIQIKQTRVTIHLATYIDSSINHHSRTTKLPTKKGRKSCA